MKKTPADNRKLSINNQHEYISLKTPTGTFTVSFNGSKCSGQLSNIPGAFKALDEYVQKQIDNKRNYGQAMNDLTDPKLMDRLVPGWDKPKVVDLKDGDMAKFVDPVFIKEYPGKYEVRTVRAKSATLMVPDKKHGNILARFQIHELEKA